MARLLSLGYANTVKLTEQHRMAPELLVYPNAAFYGGRLKCGQRAPAHGTVTWHIASNGGEEAVGTSFKNAGEARTALRLAKARSVATASVAILAPYTAQANEIIARSKDVEVHTLDAFQGREADVVVLTLVRDGRAGFGFWNDARRLTVALTRARIELHVVASPPALEWTHDTPLGAFAAACSVAAAKTSKRARG